MQIKRGDPEAVQRLLQQFEMNICNKMQADEKIKRLQIDLENAKLEKTKASEKQNKLIKRLQKQLDEAEIEKSAGKMVAENFQKMIAKKDKSFDELIEMNEQLLKEVRIFYQLF